MGKRADTTLKHHLALCSHPVVLLGSHIGHQHPHHTVLAALFEGICRSIVDYLVRRWTHYLSFFRGVYNFVVPLFSIRTARSLLCRPTYRRPATAPSRCVGAGGLALLSGATSFRWLVGLCAVCIVGGPLKTGRYQVGESDRLRLLNNLTRLDRLVVRHHNI